MAATRDVIDLNAVDKSLLTQEIAGPTVTGVRSVVSGHPAQGLTPRRLAAILRDAEDGDPMRYLELAEEMEEKDLHYQAVLGTRKRQVAQLDITVHAASDAADDEANAELVRQFVDREEIESELFDILDAIGKGFSATEIIWDLSEKQWLPARLEWRDPRWFVYDRLDGRTLHLRGEAGIPDPLPPFKFVVHSHSAKSGLPIRGGLARAASWAYLFKNYSIKDWVAFAEVYGMPLRVGKYHPSATPEEKSVLLRAVRNISSDAAAIIPEGMQLDFIKAEGGRETGALFQGMADWLDRQVSKAVLGQTTTTDAISGGHAVSREHNEVREDIERADASLVAATLNRCIVRPIVDLNRGPQKAYPWITIARPEQEDVKQIVDSVEKLVPLGLKVGQKQMARIIGLEEPEEGDELLAAAPAPAPPEPGDDPGDEPGDDAARALARNRDNGGYAAARAARLSTDYAAAAAEPPPRDSIDDLVTEMIEGEGWEPLMAELIEPLREMIDSGETLEAVRERLVELIGRMEPDRLTEALARAAFAARLAGETGADTQD